MQWECSNNELIANSKLITDEPITSRRIVSPSINIFVRDSLTNGVIDLASNIFILKMNSIRF